MNWFRILVVASLLSPAGAWADSPSVGTAAAVNPDATGTPPGGETRTLLIGNEVVFKERINTATKGQTQILFLDQSTLTIAPNSDIVLDEFVYDPNTTTGKLSISLTKGLMRYVGGEISHHGGVTVNTPVTSVTIRGAIVTAEVTTGPDGAPQSSFSLEFGKATLTSTAGGAPQELKPGTTTTVSSSGKVNVAPTTAASVQTTSDQLQGNSTDSTSSEVKVAEVSTFGDTGMPGGTAPATGSSPSGGTGGSSTSTSSSSGSGSGGTGSTSGTASNDGSTAGTGGGAPAAVTTPSIVSGSSPQSQANGATSPGQGSTTPAVVLGPFSGRYMSTPPPYTTIFGDPVSDPQAEGFVGGAIGTPNNQDFTNAQISGGRLTLTLNGTQEQIDLPIAQGQTGAFAVNGSTTTPLGSVTGMGFYDPSPDTQFFAYQLTGPGGTPDAITLFGGIPTPNQGALPGGANVSFEAWNITDFNAAAPLLPNNIGSQFPNATISPFMAVLQAGGTIGDHVVGQGTRSHMVSAELDIEGQGVSQKSMLVATVGGLFTDDGGFLYQSPFVRGIVNTGNGNLLQFVNSGLGSVPGAGATATTSSDTFFGPDLNYFVLDNNDGPDDNSQVDTDIGFITDQTGAHQNFGYTLIGQKTNTPAGLGTNRSARTLNGYVADIGQSYIPAGTGFQTPYEVTNLNGLPTDLTITTNGFTNSIVGAFNLGVPAGQSDITSGQINWGGLGYGRDAYFDDQHMAAISSAVTAGNLNGTVGAANGNQPDGWRVVMLSHDFVGTSGLLPAGVSLCTCEFLEWGYWTGKFNWNDPGGPNDSRNDLLNLGTWVAGDLTSVAEVQGLTGSATFNGHVIANISNAGNMYLAAGNFSSNWNFGTSSGSVAFGLDGRNYTGGISTGGGTPGNFSGAITGTGASAVAGQINGSFFNAPGIPAKYMGGDVAATGTGYRMSGTFAAQQ